MRADSPLPSPGWWMTGAVPERIRWAVDQLEVLPADRVLEIGCGPGRAVELLCARLTRGSIHAIDRSKLQVSRASQRNRDCIRRGRARILHLTLADAPETLGHSFDEIFAVNVNAFWTAPGPSIASLNLLSGSRTRTYLVYQPPSAAGLRRIERSMPQLLIDHGLRVDDVRISPLSDGGLICLVGRAG